MNPELSFALTVLVYVVIGGFLLSGVVWAIGAIIAGRRINKIGKRMQRDFFKSDW